MRALSIRQPWVELILAGKKAYEFRTWYPKYMPPIRVAIHASSRKPTKYEIRDVIDEFTRCYPGEELPPMPWAEHLGMVVAICDVVGVYDCASPRCPGEALRTPGVGAGRLVDGELYAWHLANMQLLEQPMPLKGALGLFEVDPEMLRTWRYLR